MPASRTEGTKRERERERERGRGMIERGGRKKDKGGNGEGK